MSNSPNVNPDPMIDEVRDIRRQIIESVGGDLDLLAEKLREVEAAYQARTGVFAGVPLEPPERSFDVSKQRPINWAVEDIRPGRG